MAMERMVRLVRVRADHMPAAAASSGPRDSRFQNLSGYVLERAATRAPAGTVVAWSYVMFGTRRLGGAQPETAPPPPRRSKASRGVLHLEPIGRLVPLAAPRVAPAAAPAARALRPVQGGQAYRIASPPARGLVTPELAEALETVFERFARERGFTPESPLEIELSRGFKAGSHGHGQGRAADIAAVGNKSILEWKREWDRAATAGEVAPEQEASADAVAAERRRNLGYALYKALQAHGGWRVNEGGWRPYRGVMQLFGPWTATEGPWQPMQIADPNPYQQQRLADQQWVFDAHQDHIHVAR
jgi:hypothetical protein